MKHVYYIVLDNLILVRFQLLNVMNVKWSDDGMALKGNWEAIKSDEEA